MPNGEDPERNEGQQSSMAKLILIASCPSILEVVRHTATPTPLHIRPTDPASQDLQLYQKYEIEHYNFIDLQYVPKSTSKQYFQFLPAFTTFFNVLTQINQE